MKKVTILLAATLLLSGCTAAQNDTPTNESSLSSQTSMAAEENATAAVMLNPYSDVRGNMFNESTGEFVESRVLTPNEYNAEDMYTYEFNEHTVFIGNEDLQQTIIENGKNPGLGIRALHDKGITGEGVTVAIIDQPLILEPDEYSDRVIEYYDCGYDFDTDEGSMHGSAVISVLVGETCGVAPGAKVYYAAAPSWNADAAYYANGLDWLISKNETLPDNEKIRLVAVQGAPSGIDSSFDKNQEMWVESVARAQAAGILIIDLRVDADTGFLEHGYYDYNDPDNIEKARNGELRYNIDGPTKEGHISVPCDFRTTIEQYDTGDYYFRYGGSGGISLGVPYAAGVLALGWQINPQLTGEEIKSLLIQTTYENEYGERIIYPAAFIESVEATL